MALRTIFDELTKDILTKDNVEWLEKNGFFTQSCSTKYHLSYEGGLLEHSLNVATNLIELSLTLGLKWERPESPIIIGLFHDLCKIDQYIWDDKKQQYVWNADQAMKGHGDKSVYYIEQNLFKLTEQEKACIRYHMGAFTDDKAEWTKYGNAITNDVNVLWTHTADMLATHVNEVKKDEQTN